MARNILRLPDNTLSGPDRITMNFWEIINEDTFKAYFYKNENQHIGLLVPIDVRQDFKQRDYLEFDTSHTQLNQLKLLIYPTNSSIVPNRGQIFLVDISNNHQCKIALEQKGTRVSFIIPSPIVCAPIDGNTILSKSKDINIFLHNMNYFINNYFYFINTIILIISNAEPQFVLDSIIDEHIEHIHKPNVYNLIIKRNCDICDSAELLLCSIHNDYDYNTFMYRGNTYSTYRRKMPLCPEPFFEIGKSIIGWDLIYPHFRLVVCDDNNFYFNSILTLTCIGMTIDLYSSDDNITQNLGFAKTDAKYLQKELWKRYFRLKDFSTHTEDEDYEIYILEHQNIQFLFNTIPDWDADRVSLDEYNQEIIVIKKLQKDLELCKIKIMMLENIDRNRERRLAYLNRLLDVYLSNNFQSFDCSALTFKKPLQDEEFNEIYWKYGGTFLRNLCKELKNWQGLTLKEIRKRNILSELKNSSIFKHEDSEEIKKLLQINSYNVFNTDFQYFPMYNDHARYPIVQYYPLTPDNDARKKYLKYKNKYLMLKKQLKDKSKF